MMELLDNNFSGPLCFYQVLEDRRKKNPYFLNRSLPFRPSRSRKSLNIDPVRIICNEQNRLRLKLIFLDHPESGSMSFHFLTFSAMDNRERTSQRISSDFIEVDQQVDIVQPLTIPPLMEDHLTTQLTCPFLFLLILFSQNPKKNNINVHIASANAFCEKLCCDEFYATPPEEMSLTFSKKGSYYALILDLSHFLPNQSLDNRNQIPLLPFAEPICEKRYRSRLVKKFKSYVHYDRLDPNLWDESISVAFSAEIDNSEDSVCIKREDPTCIGKLLFHFSAIDSSQQISCWREIRDVYDCPWCSIMKHVQTCIKFRDGLLTSRSVLGLNELLNHLVIFHPHFCYEVAVADDRYVHLIVQRRKSTDKRLGILLQHSSPTDYYIENVSEKYGDPQTKKQNELYPAEKLSRSTSKTHLLDFSSFFHPSTGQILKELDTILLDKDIDISPEIFTQHMVIDEYEDLSFQEKQFMKLWNTHIATFQSYGERFLPGVCDVFVKRYGGEIANKNLRHNLLLHLMTLWDFGLLLSEEVELFMNKIDECIVHYHQSRIVTS